MKFLMDIRFLTIISLSFLSLSVYGQGGTISGEVYDMATKEPLTGATILAKGTTNGTVTDFDGSFALKVDAFPVILDITYVGYVAEALTVETAQSGLKIGLSEDAITTEVVEITGQRISDKQKASPLTVESLDILAIKETASDNFYDGLGVLKGVDLTAASLGFKIVNTRGFNSTSPVRTLQIIDGVDNQAPGLNFSLGNFLGSPELDVLKVDLIQGASSAFYGPNAFNGVIAMETKSPFFHKGLSASVKAGERNLVDAGFRYADVVKNKSGKDFFGYKINFSFLTADDWEADNFAPIDESRVDANNPGRFDAVNIYGDEFFPLGDVTNASSQFSGNAGLGTFYRTGYKEEEVLDYDTRNIKANVGLYFRTNPDLEAESPEIIVSGNYGFGTTVYQGDNRFRLENINFIQGRIEYRKQDKYFIRAYTTYEDAGDSYDPFFTALQLQERSKSDEDWANDYIRFWNNQGYAQQAIDLGYPSLDFSTFPPSFDFEAAEKWLEDNGDQLAIWHAESAVFADLGTNDDNVDFFQPGTARFQQAFDDITGRLSNSFEGGTRFFDKSSLYHVQAEYKFEPSFLQEWIVGGNYRLYTPQSRGTIFQDGPQINEQGDTINIDITNSEFGFYTGIAKEFFGKKLRASITLRADKNENFDLISTQAASLVWKPRPNNYLRVSFSSGIRNPTLSDQFLNLNVGPAILSGNLNGADSLITTESFDVYRSSLLLSDLDYFNIDPVQPEQVRTIEAGYRTTLWNSLYVDAGYYYNVYDDFLGFIIGIEAEFGGQTTLPTDIQVFRYAANSREQVETQGFNIGLNYYFGNYFQLSGNYSWNQLISDVDDPIIPAFNTPEHKFNLGLSARDWNNFGFNINYKWIDGFLFEGSPQFTGFIPQYDLLDVQVNYNFKRINTILKVGASNVLDNQQFQTYGGPRIGRLAYASLTYEFKKR